MAKTRTYKLGCPIARALDRVGDRWTLLILRDLHAGPGRFTELQKGLTGIAANLLTDRLTKMTSDDLIEKTQEKHGAVLYQLTQTGMRTSSLLFELAQFGRQFPLQGEVSRPGNLRTLAATLGTACQRAVTSNTRLEVSILVDGENFLLIANSGQAELTYQAATNPDLEQKTSYDAMVALTDGKITFEKFAAEECEFKVHTKGKEFEFMALMTAALEQLQG
ncbi:helix-turn-helix transcriptional regulator [Parasedimentitalea maritima]|uniref:Helix-turn-helix transcriptional regulator n=1 Tax=Parasedimentitalea maritima TaxID=2578117 RepID=A0ABY2US72_9RHOB|nr:helix-turn-helix domain-containing protein [Zongyanglinia marina]TLP56837.1 helix-turn-helix transcriptional regulator [Zongyanglinia marina]